MGQGRELASAMYKSGAGPDLSLPRRPGELRALLSQLHAAQQQERSALDAFYQHYKDLVVRKIRCNNAAYVNGVERSTGSPSTLSCSSPSTVSSVSSPAAARRATASAPPPGEFSVMMSVSCSNLPQMDEMTDRVDPLVAVFARGASNPVFQYIAQTEWVMSNRNPMFHKTILLHGTQRNGEVRFSVYDVDNPKKLKREDLIGDCKIPVPQLLEWACRGGKASRPLAMSPLYKLGQHGREREMTSPTIEVSCSIVKPNEPAQLSMVNAVSPHHARNKASHDGAPVTVTYSVNCKHLPDKVLSGGKGVHVKLFAKLVSRLAVCVCVCVCVDGRRGV